MLLACQAPGYWQCGAINAISTAFGLLLVGLIARELVPRRPVIWVLSTLVALSCLTVAHLGGLIFNDGLGVAASSLTILLGIRMLRHGVTPARLAAPPPRVPSLHLSERRAFSRSFSVALPCCYVHFTTQGGVDGAGR